MVGDQQLDATRTAAAAATALRLRVASTRRPAGTSGGPRRDPAAAAVRDLGARVLSFCPGRTFDGRRRRDSVRSRFRPSPAVLCGNLSKRRNTGQAPETQQPEYVHFILQTTGASDTLSSLSTFLR